MASIAGSKESWEYNLLGNKKYGACGSRDVLILVSRESEGPDIVPRKNGELTQEDKDRLTSEGIPPECWEDDVKLMEARYLKDSDFPSVTIENIPHMKKEHALDKISTLLNNTTQLGGKTAWKACPITKNKSIPIIFFPGNSLPSPLT